MRALPQERQPKLFPKKTWTLVYLHQLETFTGSVLNISTQSHQVQEKLQKKVFLYFKTLNAIFLFSFMNDNTFNQDLICKVNEIIILTSYWRESYRVMKLTVFVPSFPTISCHCLFSATFKDVGLTPTCT